MYKKNNVGWMPDRLASFLNVKVFQVEISIHLALLVIILCGFWPVSTGIFSLKNDEIIYFLPYRYNIVENLRNGHLPLWSPYIYMGFPVSGDMQSGAWNPVVWLFALLGRYTLTSLHAELLVYVFFAAIGMYKLMRTLKFNGLICFVIAVSYSFSGFIIDSGQFICWVSCACFLPYTYVYFLRLLEQPSLPTSAKFAVANCCLLIVAGYPFFFIGNIYFLAIAYLVYVTFSFSNNQKQNVYTSFKYLTVSVLLFALVGTAPLLNFFELMPYYSRGTNLPLDAALFNSLSLFSFISFLFPFSITFDHAFFGNNHVLSRNIYIGVLLIPFVVKGIFTKRTLAWNTVLIFILFCLLISLGELLPFRKLAYWYLPLMDKFRHPSNFRLFMLVGLLAFAGKGLHEFMVSPERSVQAIKRGMYFILVLMIILATCFLPLGEKNPFTDMTLSAGGLKKILTVLSFKQSVILSLIVQIPFLVAGILLLNKKMYKHVYLLSLLNMVLLAQPQLLSSTVSKNPVSAINNFIRSQPQGFPAPLLTDSISFPNEHSNFLYEYKEPVAFFFNKQIAINSFLNNPTILKTYDNFLTNEAVVNSLKKGQLVFLADSVDRSARSTPTWLKSKATKGEISILLFEPNRFQLSINMNEPGHLVILQNNFPGWRASTNNKLLPIETVNETFMGIDIPPGSYLLDIRYQPGWLLPGGITSIAGSLIVLFLLLRERFSRRFSSSRSS